MLCLLAAAAAARWAMVAAAVAAAAALEPELCCLKPDHTPLPLAAAALAARRRLGKALTELEVASPRLSRLRAEAVVAAIILPELVPGQMVAPVVVHLTLTTEERAFQEKETRAVTRKTWAAEAVADKMQQALTL